MRSQISLRLPGRPHRQVQHLDISPDTQIFRASTSLCESSDRFLTCMRRHQAQRGDHHGRRHGLLRHRLLRRRNCDGDLKVPLLKNEHVWQLYDLSKDTQEQHDLADGCQRK